MSPDLLDFYFQLTDSNGHPVMGTFIDAVKLPSTSNVADFRKAVKIKYADSHLKGITPSDLIVYKNQNSFELRNADQGKEKPLEVDSSINNFGTDEDKALIVVIPSSIKTSSGI
jgi:hypothetical protein